jgi:alpha-glucosidase
MKSLLFIMLLSVLPMTAKTYYVESPDGRLNVEISSGERLTYSLSLDGDRLVQESEIAMILDDGTLYGGNAKVKKVSRRSVDETFSSSFYKKSSIENRFNEMTLKFSDFSLLVRAYDDGAAYRFISHSKHPFKVKDEKAGFSFADGTKAWIAYVSQNKETLETQLFNSFESVYAHSDLKDWDKGSLAFLPTLVDAGKGRKVCVMEAELLDYPGMLLYNGDGDSKLEGRFAPRPKEMERGGHNDLQMLVKSREDYIAECKPYAEFPWRILSVSENDAQMADNDMVYRLSKAPEGDFSWVKPGKVAWEWWNNWNVQGVDFKAGINNDTYKFYIDFAAEYGVEYVILDEGWTEVGKADLFKVVPEIDVKELVDYAGERGVGIILWAGYNAFAEDMEKVCSHYSALGVKGFKIDFMDRDDQLMVNFHHKAAQVCAKYHMLCDFHGTYKPTGLHRTYPNVINYEGVHGLEQCKWSDPSVLDQVTYDVTIPFIRMAAGPMDYTQGAMTNSTRHTFRAINDEPMSQGTRCRQLAEYVIFESPLNMLCDSPVKYRANSDCARFIAGVPTVWDETVALDGKVSEYISIARRSGDVWYVGALTNWTARELDLDLSFLPAGEYEVEIYQDGVNAYKFASDYKKCEMKLPADKKLRAAMASGGGWVAKIVPCR